MGRINVAYAIFEGPLGPNNPLPFGLPSKLETHMRAHNYCNAIRNVVHWLFGPKSRCHWISQAVLPHYGALLAKHPCGRGNSAISDA